jgi:hypothetical protein
MTTKHTATATPGPWYTRHGQISSETSPHGCTIANCNATAKGISDEEVEANAELIVRAVNSHAELVEALEIIDAAIRFPVVTWPDVEAGRLAALSKLARAALEKAGAA